MKIKLMYKNEVVVVSYVIDCSLIWIISKANHYWVALNSLNLFRIFLRRHFLKHVTDQYANVFWILYVNGRTTNKYPPWTSIILQSSKKSKPYQREGISYTNFLPTAQDVNRFAIPITYMMAVRLDTNVKLEVVAKMDTVFAL